MATELAAVVKLAVPARKIADSAKTNKTTRAQALKTMTVTKPAAKAKASNGQKAERQGYSAAFCSLGSSAVLGMTMANT